MFMVESKFENRIVGKYPLHPRFTRIPDPILLNQLEKIFCRIWRICLNPHPEN